MVSIAYQCQYSRWQRFVEVDEPLVNGNPNHLSNRRLAKRVTLVPTRERDENENENENENEINLCLSSWSLRGQIIWVAIIAPPCQRYHVLTPPITSEMRARATDAMMNELMSIKHIAP